MKESARSYGPQQNSQSRAGYVPARLSLPRGATERGVGWYYITSTVDLSRFLFPVPSIRRNMDMAEFFELCSDGTHLEEVGRRLASLDDEERVAAVRQVNPDQVGRTCRSKRLLNLHFIAVEWNHCSPCRSEQRSG